MKNKYTILAMATSHPDSVNKYRGLFNKNSIETLAKTGLKIKTIAPRPYAPFFSRYAKIPKEDFTGTYPVYFPRFWYMVPKKIFYGVTGKSYSKHIGKFLEKYFARPDIVHAFHIYLDGYGVLNYCKNNDLPLVVQASGTVVREIVLWGNIKPKIMQTLDYSSNILCVSLELAERIENMGVPPDKVSVVPLGTDLQRFRMDKKSEIKKAMGLDDCKIILFVGHLTKKKGLDTLVEISEIILGKYGHKVKFIVVGDGPYRKEINRRENVIATGHMSPEKVADLFIATDIFILPSLAEGRPTVIYEAMASECAIVASNVGGIPEQIKEGYSGVLVEPGNAKIFADKICYLLDNQNEITKMGKNGKKRLIEKGWTYDEYAKQTIAIYKKLV